MLASNLTGEISYMSYIVTKQDGAGYSCNPGNDLTL